MVIERYNYPEQTGGLGKYLNTEWIRVKTNNSIFANDFLIIVSRRIFMKIDRKKSDNLYTSLLEFKNQ